MKEFIPNPPADVRYIVLDMLDEKDVDRVSSTQVYERLKEVFNEMPLKRSFVNDVLINLYENEVIVQAEGHDSPEYWWKKPESETIDQNKKQKKISNPEAPKKIKNAKKMVQETTEGPITYWVVSPDKWKEEEFKGYWVGTTEESLDYYLFEKTMKSSLIKEFLSQLIRCAKEAVKVKKNF